MSDDSATETRYNDDAIQGSKTPIVVSDVQLPGISGIELGSLMTAASSAQQVDVLSNTLAQHFGESELVSYKSYTHALSVVPPDWLEWADERSGAGAGHGERLAQLVDVISLWLPDWGLRIDDLKTAAYAHEIGLLAGVAADPVELSWRGADLLTDLGADSGPVRIVRHLHERWDGTGGPDQLSGTMIPIGAAVLAVADALDHYTAAWIQAGIDPMDAVDRSIGLLVTQKNTLFSPRVVDIVEQERSTIRSICAECRSGGPTHQSSKETRVYPAIARTLLDRLS